MPILLAGEDVASDCFARVGAGAGLLAGGDCARRGIAKHNVATTRRGLTIECLLEPASGLAHTSEPMYVLKVDNGVRPYRCLLLRIPVVSYLLDGPVRSIFGERSASICNF
jgi:hypothetical protein